MVCHSQDMHHLSKQDTRLHLGNSSMVEDHPHKGMVTLPLNSKGMEPHPLSNKVMEPHPLSNKVMPPLLVSNRAMAACNRLMASLEK